MKKILLGACALVLMAGFATAQTATTPQPPAPPVGQQVDQQDDQGGWGGWWGQGRRHGGRDGGHGGHHMRGGQDGGGRGFDGGGQGGPGMQIDRKGFSLMVGPGHGLRINCGDEPMKDCIAAAQPLIDSLGKLDFKPPMPPVAPAQ